MNDMLANGMVNQLALVNALRTGNIVLDIMLAMLVPILLQVSIPQLKR
jgi:hypothetical protein